MGPREQQLRFPLLRQFDDQLLLLLMLMLLLI
jgi:hypothetical protein